MVPHLSSWLEGFLQQQQQQHRSRRTALPFRYNFRCLVSRLVLPDDGDDRSQQLGYLFVICIRVRSTIKDHIIHYYRDEQSIERVFFDSEYNFDVPLYFRVVSNRDALPLSPAERPTVFFIVLGTTKASRRYFHRDMASSSATNSSGSGSSKTPGGMSKTQDTTTTGGFRSANVIHSNMSSEMKDYCISLASFKLKEFDKGEYSHYKDIAKQLKGDFDKKFGGSWHVIVGKSFGSFVTAERNKYVAVVLVVVVLLFSHAISRSASAYHPTMRPPSHARTFVLLFLLRNYLSFFSQGHFFLSRTRSLSLLRPRIVRTAFGTSKCACSCEEMSAVGACAFVAGYDTRGCEKAA